ncbi:MAG: DUF2721 domain-containing protein [Gammaproteobacteria bacterium]|nr:DUF2721 domain-containing protein [Gammaproteobacteria bacterium]
MEISLTTPALLFPAISLLLVAYTNRFNAISSRIRSLHSAYKENPNKILVSQITSLKRRVYIIRNMQGFGVASLFLCIVCMFALFAGTILLGKIIFGLSLILMLASLGYSLQEIFISVQALNFELSELQKHKY